MTDLVYETADRLFRDHVDKALLDAAEAGSWPAALWQAVEENGLADALLGETADGAAVLSAAGKHGAPLPIAETMIGRALLSRAGIDVPAGTLALAPVERRDRIRIADDVASGTAHGVAWAERAACIVVIADGRIACVDPASTRIEAGTNLAGEPRSTVIFDGKAAAAADAPVDAEGLQRLGAWARAVQMAGAMESALEIATVYANDRVQFGRPIGKIQVIQHQLALMAEEVAAAGVATRLATERLEGLEAFLAVAAAKIRGGEAAGKAAEYAHQVMGAIGFTHEHTLHHLTRRLWSWRDEFGRESDWSIALGRLVGRVGADGLWPWLARA
ncbi:MAG: acyl-CoA dehydrogenase family protein [Alphaproteobacteria bacterium]